MVRDFIKFSEKGRALVELPEKGRQLVSRLPKPVQLGLKSASRRSLRFTFEIFAGLLVIGAMAVALAYGRLNQGPVSLPFLVPILEEAINRELADAEVKIDDAVVRRGEEASDVQFRLRNIRLIDSRGSVVAQAPYAAIGLSGRGLLGGRIAPGSVDFIGPRLLLFYSPSGGLSLSFSSNQTSPPSTDGGIQRRPRNDGTAGEVVTRGVVPPLPEGGVGLDTDGLGRINLTQSIADAFEKARMGTTASSYLTRFGVRDAVVVFNQNGEQSFWQVPDFAIDLQHGKKRSILMGEANISSSEGPWSLNFSTEQSQKRQQLTFTAMIKDLVPKGIAANLPGLGGMGALEMPVSVETSVDMSTGGALLGAEARIKLSAGHIRPPWDVKYPMLIDEGELHVRYLAREDKIELLPSTILWGESRAVISGVFEPVAQAPQGEDGAGVAQPKSWRFRLQADDAVLGVEEFGLAPVPVDEWFAEGVVTPDSGHLEVSRFHIRMGTASMTLQGTVVDAPGSPEVKMTGQLSAMSIDQMKKLWPKFVAAGARQWSGKNLTAGQILGGKARIDIAAGELAKLEQGGDIAPESVQFDLQTTGVEIHYIEKLPPIQTAAGVMRLRGRSFEFSAPKAWVDLPSGKRIDLKDGRFVVDDLRPLPEIGELTFTAAGGAAAVLELLDHDPLGYAKKVGFSPEMIGGDAEGKFRISLPTMKGLEFNDVTLRGDVNLDAVTLQSNFEGVAIEGGTVVFNATEKAIQARGDVVLNGVPAQINWQRIFAAPDDKQPDLRVSTVLNEAERTKLGFDINHMVRGPVPVSVNVRDAGGKKKKIRVEADLSKADLVMTNFGWRKPSGQSANLQFDVADGQDGNTELQNFRVAGDNIGIEGWIGLNEKGKPKAFFFPDFSFNVITHLELAGNLRSDNVWDVQAQGSGYDGRQFFESLFSAGQLAEDQVPPAKDEPGLDLTAQIATVMGFSNTTVKNAEVSLIKRGGKLQRLDAKGKLNGKSPIAVRLNPEEGQPRVLLAEAQDAGAAFRLVGFYPKIEGGDASLQVNLDGSGRANTTGTLWARDFVILGDRVVNQLVVDQQGGAASSSRSRQRRMQPQRRRIAFNQLRAPFSVGQGQFVLHNSYVNGPMLGATMRGRVDFKTKRVDLGGTYVPLYGLNSALGSIPIIGNLLVGRRGEGVLGITFAIKGSLSEPKVMMNPVSMVAPGIFRQIFEFTGRSQVLPPPPNIANAPSNITDTPPPQGIGTAPPATQLPVPPARSTRANIPSWIGEAPSFPGDN